MAPPKYKDLGKKANDILNEDFKFEQTFELKSKLNGMEGSAHRDTITSGFSPSCHLALIPHCLAACATIHSLSASSCQTVFPGML